MQRSLVTALGCLIVSFLSFPAFGQTAYPDVADHLGYTFTIDVLANDVEPNGEALTVSIDADTCPNTVTVVEGLIRVESTLGPDAGGPAYTCTIDYRIEDETGHQATSFVTVVALPPILVDGFESGTTGAWSETVINGTGAL